MAYQRQGQRTIIYISSTVDNFEMIVGLDVGIPLFIFFPL
jgi:hypothetical protein